MVVGAKTADSVVAAVPIVKVVEALLALPKVELASLTVHRPNLYPELGVAVMLSVVPEATVVPEGTLSPPDVSTLTVPPVGFENVRA